MTFQSEKLFRFFDDRVSTFEGIIEYFEVEDIPYNMIKMANAGFFYLGFDDLVQCFECDVVLFDWQNDDEPWIEHAKYSPECAYLQHYKSPYFIRDCVALLAENTEKPLQQSVSTLTEDGENHSNRILCKICYDNEMNYLVMPCFHISCCEECIKKVNKCPICNNDIHNKMKIFLS